MILSANMKFMKRLISAFALVKGDKRNSSKDPLYHFVEKASSREKVRVIKKVILKTNKEQRAIMTGNKKAAA